MSTGASQKSEPFQISLAPRHATSECLSLYEGNRELVVEIQGLVREQLIPASTTEKRKAATHRLLGVLEAIRADLDELHDALADVEDAV